MAGLAAALNAPDSIDAIAWALAARGADGALCRLVGAGGADLQVAVRAAMPSIPRVVPAQAAGDDGDDGDPSPIAALVIDGIASMTALDHGYAEHGPAGLIDGGDLPYAVILADAERDELVLARNGAGPSLYYARLDSGWVAASEPGALLQAGVAAEPDVAVIRRFIQTGQCDDSERTFFAQVRRVLPGEAVVLGTAVSGAVRQPSDWKPPEPSTAEAIWKATESGQMAVLLTPGLAGAAVLGGALHQPERPQPLPVFTTSLAGIDGSAAQPPAVLMPLRRDTVTHTSLTAEIGPADLDRFLADMGEPVPDLDLYLLWTVVRSLSGGLDTLVDTTPGRGSGLERVRDRLLAHYGVAVRCPLREAPANEEVLSSVVTRTMPPQLARYAELDPARAATPTQIVLALREEIAAALVPPRPWSDAVASITALRRLSAGEPVAADALLRAYLVERWLACLGPQATVVPNLEPEAEAPQPRPLRGADEVVVGGEVWRRIPVRTALVAAGDPFHANTAFHVVNTFAEHREVPFGPWFVAVSGKAVAVSQNRLELVLDVLPGPAARMLAPLARRRWPHLGEAWAMQVAIDHSGLSPMLGAVLMRREMPAEAKVYPPRTGAVAPADSAVVRPPFRPDEVASSLVAALRLALPAELGDSLAGVAVVSADAAGCRVLGYADGPCTEVAMRPARLLPLVLADNPAGQGTERTPIVVVVQNSPHVEARRPLATEDAGQLATRSR
jgi:hypothetical protein